MKGMPGIYVHIPFCKRRCDYCDFITYAGQEALLPAYVEAVRKEMRFMSARTEARSTPAVSLYIGGGTPSLLSPEQVGQLVETARECFDLRADAEITLEANPGTNRPGLLTELRASGINRISLGVQSFRDQDLRQIGRIHSAEEALTTIVEAQEAGFTSISIDLIFGLPGQTSEGWAQNLEQAFTLGVNHLSLYSLILEEGTPLAARVAKGLVSLPDDDATADMFELAVRRAQEAGWTHYEISNFAQTPAFEARHNKLYWQNEPYLGFGAAAHGCSGLARVENVPTIVNYIERMNTGICNYPYPATAATEKMTVLDEMTRMQESMMLGLRFTREGVSARAFEQKHGQAMAGVFQHEIARLIRRQLVEWVDFADGPHLRLTKRGVLVGNQAFMEFV